MATVQGFCDRAMLIHDGELRYIGDPEEAALRYYRLNFGGASAARPAAPAGCPTSTCASSTPGSRTRPASASRTWSRASRSAWTSCFEARARLEAPDLRLPRSSTRTARPCSAFNRTLTSSRRRRIGSRPAGACGSPAAIENPLLPGRYFVNCWISRNRDAGRPRAARRAAARVRRLRDATPGPGSVSVRADVEAASSRMRRAAERRRRRAARGARPVRARRRLAALARAALPDRRRPSSSAATSAPRSAICGRSRGR